MLDRNEKTKTNDSTNLVLSFNYTLIIYYANTGIILE
jgi:hypothetical protein